MTDPGLRSAPVPELAGDDHVRGRDDAPLVVMYADFECPWCAWVAARLVDRPVRVVFRHFPVRSKHPRAWPAALAAEAAARQGAFWPMHDALFADQGRLDDPHLWRRAERLGLDVAAFDRARRVPELRARVQRDFRSGIRAGVPTTPTLFHGGARLVGRPPADWWERLGMPAGPGG